MQQHTLFGLAFAASLLVGANAASAHADHDTPKLKPTTCEQLADRARYSNDLAYPDIKALKDKCDAEKVAESPSKEAKKDE
jgi:hypothetical protein